MKLPRLVVQMPIEADTHPDLPIDQGKHGDGVGAWVAQDKHRLLATYIDAARSAARTKFSQWVYIDPFCGPGRMQARGEQVTRPGGAMVAWCQSLLSGTPFGTVMIGDLSEQKLAACETRLVAAGAPVRAFAGPASETATQMVRAVPPGALCLVYIDPYNLALLTHEMIATFARLRKVDIVVHFSTMDLLRNADAELDPVRARFDDVSPGWRQRLAAASKATLADRFFNDWHDQVLKLKFTVSQTMPLIRNDEQREIYKLVFFARHELPMGLWADIARERRQGSLF